MRTATITILFVMLGAFMLCPSAATAQAVWTDGTITKAPRQDKRIHIGVNDVPYTFLNKDIRVAQHYEVKPGMYNEQRLSLEDLTVGQKVMIRAQGHRIYELRVVQ